MKVYDLKKKNKMFDNKMKCGYKIKIISKEPDACFGCRDLKPTLTNKNIKNNETCIG